MPPALKPAQDEKNGIERGAEAPHYPLADGTTCVDDFFGSLLSCAEKPFYFSFRAGFRSCYETPVAAQAARTFYQLSGGCRPRLTSSRRFAAGSTANLVRSGSTDIPPARVS